MTLAEAAATTVSRRSTRLFAKDQDDLEMGPTVSTHEPKYSSSSDEKDKEKPPREAKIAPSNPSFQREPILDFGFDLFGMFPTTVEDISKQARQCIQAAEASNKSKVDGRPLNFGVVLPDTIYRSSYPMTEDFQFLGTLGLKTIVSLVNKDFPAGFKSFIKVNGIRHCIVEMQGTKKVEIPDAVMNSIMEVVLNKENHPLLIHCNHGKHRTGCAAAVVRHVSGWSVDQIVQEYEGYAEPKVRPCDIKYITDYKVEKLADFLNTRKDRPRHRSTLTTWKMQRFLLTTAAIIVVWVTTGLVWGDKNS